jgi:hypothetical protein
MAMMFLTGFIRINRLHNPQIHRFHLDNLLESLNKVAMTFLTGSIRINQPHP